MTVGDNELLLNTMSPFGKDFLSKVQVRNTFLDISAEDDAWTVGLNSNLRRQQTDSILHRNSSLREDLARATLKVEEALLPELPTMPMTLSIDQGAFTRTEEDDEHEEDSEEPRDASETNEQNDSKVSPEIHAMREIALNGGGLSGCTTVMMRNVPLKYTQRKLLREINNSGFMGQYDFIYLPMDPRSHSNRGFAFINMLTAEAAEQLYKQFHGQHLRHFIADNAIAVLPADLQGFEENALQYASTAAHRGRRTGHTKPIFFRPLPSHIAAKLDENRLTAPPPVQVVAKACLPERSLCFNDENTQRMAAMLQQALLPTMMKPSLPFALAQTQQENLHQPAIAAKQVPCFCVYCGKKRLPAHLFCPYCGGSFQD